MIILVFIIIAIVSYFLGSLNFGVILSKSKQDDVRKYGSGNAGTTNMLRNYGKGYAVMTIAGDMAKVAAAILISFFVISLFKIDINSIGFSTDFFGDVDNKMLVKSFSGFFCVLGHIFPCFFKFKGGKGVATAGGMVFMIDWRIALILLTIFFIVVIITKYVSLGSLVMAVLYPVFIYIFHKSLVLTVIAAVFTLVVAAAHRDNIKKLINHTENKITDKMKKVTKYYFE